MDSDRGDRRKPGDVVFLVGEILLDLEVFSRYPWLVAWGEAEAEKCVCVCVCVFVCVV